MRERIDAASTSTQSETKRTRTGTYRNWLLPAFVALVAAASTVLITLPGVSGHWRNTSDLYRPDITQAEWDRVRRRTQYPFYNRGTAFVTVAMAVAVNATLGFAATAAGRLRSIWRLHLTGTTAALLFCALMAHVCLSLSDRQREFGHSNSYLILLFRVWLPVVAGACCGVHVASALVRGLARWPRVVADKDICNLLAFLIHVVLLTLLVVFLQAANSRERQMRDGNPILWMLAEARNTDCSFPPKRNRRPFRSVDGDSIHRLPLALQTESCSGLHFSHRQLVLRDSSRDFCVLRCVYAAESGWRTDRAPFRCDDLVA